MSPDLKQLFKLLFVLLREKNKSHENFKAGLQRVVILLDRNRKLQNELGKLFAQVYAKHQDLHLSSNGVFFEADRSLVPVETRESAMKWGPAREHTVKDKGSEHRWHFHMRQGTAKSCILVVFACGLLLDLYSLWGQNDFFTLTPNNNSTTGLVTYKIEPNYMLSLLSDKQLKESLHRSLDDATFADVLYSNEFVLEPLDELILQNSPEQISTLTNVRLLLDYHVLYTNSKLGGVRGTKPHAHTLQDIWKTYTVVNRTEVSTLKWDLAGKPAALEQVRANYHARVKTVLGRAVQTIGMYFDKGNIPPVITEYAQQASTHKVHVQASSRDLQFEWVLIRDQNNTNDIHALDLFIGNICDTLKERTNATEFETRKLNMALLFKKVYTELKNKSADLCTSINAPELWQNNPTKPAPISMHDLFTDAFTKRLERAQTGEKHDVFIYEMVKYQYDLVQIDGELKKTGDDIEMHVLFEVLLHTLSFQCNEHPNFALKPVFIGYVPGNKQQTWSGYLTQLRFPHYIDFAQSDHLLYQLVPLLLPRKWKAVSGDTVSGMTLAPDSQVLQFTDFEPCLTYNLPEMFASDTYELTRDAYARHESRLFYDNMYMHVSNGVEQLFLVPYISTHTDPSSFLSAIVPMLQRRLSSNAFNNFMHARSRIFSKIPIQLQSLVSIVQDKIVPKLSWDKLSIMGTGVGFILTAYFTPLQLVIRRVENMFDRITRNLNAFYYVVASLLVMICVLFNFLNITSSAAKDIPRLEALINSFDMVGFFDIIVDLFFMACNMYQFCVESDDSFNIPDTLGYYYSNIKDKSRRQKIRNCFLNKNTVEELVSTMRQCSNELEAHFEERASRAESAREYAEIVVGYCRVLSLRMFVLYLRRQCDEQSHSTEHGTLNALEECNIKLTKFYNKHSHLINDETIRELKVNTQTTVIEFKQFLLNMHNDKTDSEMQKQIGTLLSSVNSPMGNGGDTTRAVLENVAFLMLGFFVKQRACLVMFAQCAEGRVQRRAQHLLYDSFKYQLLLQHSQSFAQLLAFGTAVFEIGYYGSILFSYYGRQPGSFVKGVRLVPHGSDDVVRTFMHANGTPLSIHLYASTFSRTVLQEIKSAERVYIPMIARAIENARTTHNEHAEHAELRAGAGASGERTPSTPPAAHAGSHASPGATESASSDERTGEDSVSGSDAQLRKPTENIIMDLRSMGREADVKRVNAKLKEIFQSFEQDRIQEKSAQSELNFLFKKEMPHFKNYDGDSFDWSIRILSEHVLNTCARVNLSYLEECLESMQTLKSKCTKTDNHERNLNILETAIQKRVENRKKCMRRDKQEDCMQKLKQLLQCDYKPRT